MSATGPEITTSKLRTGHLFQEERDTVLHGSWCVSFAILEQGRGPTPRPWPRGPENAGHRPCSSCSPGHLTTSTKLDQDTGVLSWKGLSQKTGRCLTSRLHRRRCLFLISQSPDSDLGFHANTKHFCMVLICNEFQKLHFCFFIDMKFM